MSEFNIQLSNFNIQISWESLCPEVLWTLSAYITWKKYRKNWWKKNPSEDVFENQTDGNWSVMGKYLCTFNLFLHLSSGVCYWAFCEILLNGLVQYRRYYSLIQKWVLNWTHWTNVQGLKAALFLLCSTNIWSNKLYTSDVKVLVDTGTVPQKHSAPNEKVEASLHNAPQCFWMRTSNRARSQVCRPALCGFQTRRDFHMTKAEQGQKCIGLSIYTPLKRDLSERKKTTDFVRTLFLFPFTCFL